MKSPSCIIRLVMKLKHIHYIWFLFGIFASKPFCTQRTPWIRPLNRTQHVSRCYSASANRFAPPPPHRIHSARSFPYSEICGIITAIDIGGGIIINMANNIRSSGLPMEIFLWFAETYHQTNWYNWYSGLNQCNICDCNSGYFYRLTSNSFWLLAGIRGRLSTPSHLLLCYGTDRTL